VQPQFAALDVDQRSVVINNKDTHDERHRDRRTAADPDVVSGRFHLMVDPGAGRTESNVAVGVTAALAIVMEVKMTRSDSTDGPEFRDEFGGPEPASDTDAFGGPEPASDTDAFGGPEPASDTDAFGGPQPE
jgi:hypothetical protein